MLCGFFVCARGGFAGIELYEHNLVAYNAAV